jgi:hypothetical protein
MHKTATFGPCACVCICVHVCVFYFLLVQSVFDECDAVPHGAGGFTLLIARAVVVQVDGAAQGEVHQQSAPEVAENPWKEQ